MEYWNEILIHSGIASIAALGLYVTMSTGQLSVGHAAFFGIGAYFSGYLTVHGVPFAAALLLTLIAGGIVGFLSGTLFLRLSHWILAAATLGFGETVRVLILNLEVLGGARGFYGVPLVVDIWIVYACLLVVLLFVWRLDTSRIGSSFRLTGEDEVMAASLGIDPRRCRVESFTIGAVICSLAGVLYMHKVGIIMPKNLGFADSVNLLIYVALGGVGTPLGPVLGAFTLTILPEVLRFSLYSRYLFMGVILVIIIVARPQGLLIRRPLVPRISLPLRPLAWIWPTYNALYRRLLSQSEGPAAPAPWASSVAQVSGRKQA